MASPLDPSGIDADLALDVFAANLRLAHQDAAQQAERLAARLTQLVPHLCTRTESGGLFGRKTLKNLRVALGADHFDLSLERGETHYCTVHHVGGIDLAHHEVSQDAWIDGLMAALAAQAEAQSDAQSGQGACRLL